MGLLIYNEIMDGVKKKAKIASFVEFKKVLEGSKNNSLYEGFEYNKLAKDVNGFSLNFEHLKNYGSKIQRHIYRPSYTL